MIYAGPIADWNMAQAAHAAAILPGYEATEKGLGELQQRWYECASVPPDRRSDIRDMAWARAAFKDIQSRSLKYEAVPA